MRNESTSWSICRIRIMTIFFTRTISKYQKQNVLHQNCGEKKKFNLCIKCVSLKLMIHWQIPIYCAVRIPLLDIYLFSVSLYPDSSSLSLFPVWHWSKFTKLIWFYFAICAQKPFFSTHLLESLSAMIWPSFRAVSSAACLSASACFNLHTQTKAGDTNMQNKKKKTIKTNYDKNICLYICVHLYIKDGMGHVEKLRWIKEHDVWNTITFGN